MKAFTFKQNRILKLRKQQVAIAELEVARAAGEVSLSKAGVAKQLAHINELDGQMHSRTPNLTHISLMSVHLRQRLEESRRQLKQQEQLLGSAILGLRTASQAVEALAALETRQRDKHERKQQGQEQAAIDSFSTFKWVREG